MARQLDIGTTRQRGRNNIVTDEMVAKAAEAFFANKESNLASQRARKAQGELAKLMAQGGVDEFLFTSETPSGGQARVRAAIEPIITDVIDVNKLRTLVDDATFMSVIKATKGEVEKECGSHVANKAMRTDERPPELKIKEVKE